MVVLAVSLAPHHHMAALNERLPAGVRTSVHSCRRSAVGACAVGDLLHLAQQGGRRDRSVRGQKWYGGPVHAVHINPADSFVLQETL